jgi:hypothetical protein
MIFCFSNELGYANIFFWFAHICAHGELALSSECSARMKSFETVVFILPHVALRLVKMMLGRYGACLSVFCSEGATRMVVRAGRSIQ